MERKVKKHLCSCGENNPDKFSKKSKSLCKVCDSIRSKERYKNLSVEKKKSIY